MGTTGEASADPGVREGDLLADKYRIDKILGAGGMGVVVAARHIHLDERVAIKFLLPQTLANRDAVNRFAREARAAVKIKSEHVARVADVGTLQNGAPYMVMEYLEGSDLSAWLKERGSLPAEQAVEFVLQASEAIAEAHALGIVHRDLKPANLFVIRRTDGVLSVKVLDFGISKASALSGSGASYEMTKTSAVMGSPLYMSPEQMQSSKDVDARADIWALGVVLYELIAGETPFIGETLPEVVAKIMASAPEPLGARRPGVPAGLEAAILRCLEKDRGKRYASIGELAVALLPFGPKRAKASVERISGVMQAAGLSASALALPPSSDAADPTTATQTGAAWGRTSIGASRGSKVFLAGVGAVGVLAVGFLVVRHPSDPTPESAVQATSVTAPRSTGPLPPPAPEPQAPEPRIEPARSAAAEVSPAKTAPASTAPEGRRFASKKPPKAEAARPAKVIPVAPSPPAPPPAPPAAASARAPARPAAPTPPSMYDDRK